MLKDILIDKDNSWHVHEIIVTNHSFVVKESQVRCGSVGIKALELIEGSNLWIDYYNSQLMTFVVEMNEELVNVVR